MDGLALTKQEPGLDLPDDDAALQKELEALQEWGLAPNLISEILIIVWFFTHVLDYMIHRGAKAFLAGTEGQAWGGDFGCNWAYGCWW